jgi:hypothetical protein
MWLGLMKLNELEVGKKYKNKISNSFAALDNLYGREEMKRAWEIFKRLSTYQLKEV